MRLVPVVVDPPFLDEAVNCCHAAEQVLVEAFVAEAAAQVLEEAVLGRLTGGNVVPLEAIVLLPLQERPRRQLGAVAGDRRRASSIGRAPRQWRSVPAPPA